MDKMTDLFYRLLHAEHFSLQLCYVVPCPLYVGVFDNTSGTFYIGHSAPCIMLTVTISYSCLAALYIFICTHKQYEDI